MIRLSSSGRPIRCTRSSCRTVAGPPTWPRFAKSASAWRMSREPRSPAKYGWTNSVSGAASGTRGWFRHSTPKSGAESSCSPAPHSAAVAGISASCARHPPSRTTEPWMSVPRCSWRGSPRVRGVWRRPSRSATSVKPSRRSSLGRSDVRADRLEGLRTPGFSRSRIDFSLRRPAPEEGGFWGAVLGGLDVRAGMVRSSLRTITTESDGAGVDALRRVRRQPRSP